MTHSGPQINSTLNPLPAYRLQVRSEWEVWMQYSYEAYRIVNGAYVPDLVNGRTGIVQVDSLRTRVSYRAWDPQQGTLTGLEGSPNCNATSAGYIPVPVMEGQTVLVR